MLIDTVDYSSDKDTEEEKGGKNDSKDIFNDKGKAEVNDDNIEDIMRHLERHNS